LTAFFYKYTMNLKELHSFKLSDALHFHEDLNPVIFNGDRMDDDVRERLLLIAKDFLEHLGINDLDIEDVTLSGSNAAFSYTRHSDIDVHILVNMNKFNNDDVYRELFDAKKIVYNDQHAIKIGGYDVELYVQDSNQPVISLGEYSILNDKWIKLPRKRRADLDQAAAKLKFQKIAKLAEFALKSNNYEKIQNVLKVLKKYRQAGLDLNGEFGAENIAYKALRSQKIIQKLYDKLNDLHSERLSLPEDVAGLNVPTLTPLELAKLHRVSREDILKELSKGIKIEMEHTKQYTIAKEIASDHLKEDPKYYTKLLSMGLEEGASGYIPSNAEKDDPRFKTALTVDVKPDTMKKNAKAFGFNISRAGIPPLLRK
jgi:hypothetical protein